MKGLLGYPIFYVRSGLRSANSKIRQFKLLSRASSLTAYLCKFSIQSQTSATFGHLAIPPAPQAAVALSIMDSQDEALVKQFVNRSINAAIRRQYDRAFQNWTAFVLERGWPSMPVPATRLSVFLAHLGHSSAGQAAVSSAVAAIAHKHAEEGLPSPTTCSEVRKMLSGIKKTLARPAVRRDPLTFEILRDLGVIVREDGSTAAWRTFWRMNIQFFALLRWEEVSRLRVSDFSFHLHHMDVRIRSTTRRHFRTSSKAVEFAGSLPSQHIVHLHQNAQVRANGRRVYAAQVESRNRRRHSGFSHLLFKGITGSQIAHRKIRP